MRACDLAVRDVANLQRINAFCRAVPSSAQFPPVQVRPRAFRCGSLPAGAPAITVPATSTQAHTFRGSCNAPEFAWLSDAVSTFSNSSSDVDWGRRFVKMQATTTLNLKRHDA